MQHPCQHIFAVCHHCKADLYFPEFMAVASGPAGPVLAGPVAFKTAHAQVSITASNAIHNRVALQATKVQTKQS